MKLKTSGIFLLSFFVFIISAFLTDGHDARAFEKTFRNSNAGFGNYCTRNFPRHLTSAMGVEDTGFFRVDNMTDDLGDLEPPYRDEIGGHEDGVVLVEHYDKNFKYLSQTWISRELPKYGGFCQGSDGYFFLFGKNNTMEKDDTEVWRIVKYDKSWKRVASASVKSGFDTPVYNSIALPSSDMYESGGILYVNTNLEGYGDQTDTHHQWSYKIVIDAKNMKVLKHSDQGGATHSFRQFVIRDSEGRVLFYEQSDGSPERGAILFRNNEDPEDERYDGTGIYGDFDVFSGDVVNTWYYGFNENSREDQDARYVNDTHATIGGLVDTKKNYITAGSSTFQEKGESMERPIHNAYITVTPKDDFTEDATKMIWLTSYKENKDQTKMAGTPYIVKLSDDCICVLWSYDSGWKSGNTIQYVFIDGDGNLISDVKTVTGQLSDCRPVASSVTGETKVHWMVSTNTDVVLYSLDRNGELTSKAATGFPDSMAVFPRKLDDSLNIYCNHIGSIPSGFGDYENLYNTMFTIFDKGFPNGGRALVSDYDFDINGRSDYAGGEYMSIRFKCTGKSPYYYGSHTYTGKPIDRFIQADHVFYSNHAATVRWFDYCDGALGYTLYRKIGSGSYKKIRSYKNSGKKRFWKYIDKKVNRSQNVSYRIRAYTKTKSGKKIYSSLKTPPAYSSVLTLSESAAKLKLTKKLKLKAVIKPRGKKVVFSSSDTKIARVNSSGTVIPVSPGVAVITARCGGQESICFVTVTKNVNYLGHNPGQEKALRAFIKKAAASGADISTDTDDSCYKWDEDGYLKLVFFDDIGLKGNLDFSAFTRLNTIYMYDCPDVTGIDVTGCEKLKILHIYQYDDRGSIKNIDLSGNKMLEHLVLDKQEIGEIDLSHNSELKDFSFTGLPATSIDTGKNTKLESYMIEDMNIDSLDISGNKALKQLCLTNCEIKNTDTIDVRGYASLERMILEGLSWLNKLYVSGCEKLTRVVAKKTGLTELDFTGCKAYEGFDPYDFGGSGIKRLKFNGCSSMKEFSYASNFTHTELESVDLSGCTGLTELSLPSRLFSTVDIRSFHDLRKIDIDSLPAGIITPGKYDGQYEGDIDLSGLGELREVFISGNHIKNLKLTGVRKLKRLKAINCGIESIVFDPAGHPMLTILETNLNDLKEFIAPDLPALRTVYLSGNNNLSTIDLSGAPSLKSLSTDPIGGALKSIVLNSALKDSAELSLTPKSIKEIITYK